MYEFNEETNTFRLSGVPYQVFLAALHKNLAPRNYLEIGTRTGASLAFVQCDAIAVDAQFALQAGVTGSRRRTHLFQMTSDDFFATEDARELFGRPVDLTFLDGMHRFEFLLRDLIGAEAVSHPRSLILLHDCLPLNTRMTSRLEQPGDVAEGDTRLFWTGDVWKLLPVLRKYRPDLRVHIINCPPTGLIAITQVDPQSRVLAENYYQIMDEYAPMVMDESRLKSTWKELELTDSWPLCREPDRLTELFSLY